MAESFQTDDDLNGGLGRSDKASIDENERLTFLKLLTDANLIEEPLELRTREMANVKNKLDGV